MSELELLGSWILHLFKWPFFIFDSHLSFSKCPIPKLIPTLLESSFWVWNTHFPFRFKAPFRVFTLNIFYFIFFVLSVKRTTPVSLKTGFQIFVPLAFSNSHCDNAKIFMFMICLFPIIWMLWTRKCIKNFLSFVPINIHKACHTFIIGIERMKLQSKIKSKVSLDKLYFSKQATKKNAFCIIA